MKRILGFWALVLLVLPARIQAQAVAGQVKALEKQNYAITIPDRDLTLYSNTKRVKDPTCPDGQCAWVTADKVTWSIQWKYGPETFAEGVSYTIYIVAKVNKTGDSGNAFMVGIYDLKKAANAVPARIVKTSEIKGAGWDVYEVGRLIPQKEQYVYVTATGDNGAVIKDIFVDEFIVVPTVTAENEAKVREHYQKYAKDRNEEDALVAFMASHMSQAPARVTDRFAFGAFLASGFSGMYGSWMPSFYGDKWTDKYRRVCVDFKRNYMDTMGMFNAPEDDQLETILKIAGETGVSVFPGSYIIPTKGKALDEKGLKDVLGPIVRRFDKYDSLLTWYPYDEPGTELFLPLMKGKRVIDELSPGKSAMFVLNMPETISKYGPYVPVVLIDPYPIFQQRPHDPWVVGRWVENARDITGRPVWIVPQAVGELPGAAKPALSELMAKPTVPEFRLMTYLAIANGATGVVYYHYDHTPYWQWYAKDKPPYPGRKMEEGHLVNGFEGPGEFMEEAKRIGRDLTAVGPLLVNTRPMETAGIKSLSGNIAIPGKREISKLLVKVFEKDNKTLLLVAVNNDLAAEIKESVKIDPGMLSGRDVYDLYRLEKVPVPKGEFSVNLLPGDGRIYLLADKNSYAAAKSAILATRWQKEKAIFEIDLNLGIKSGLTLTSLEKAYRRAKTEAENRKFETALNSLAKCAAGLEKVFTSDAAFNASRTNLKESQQVLAGIDGRLRAPEILFNNEELRVKGRDLMKVVGAQYFALLNRFLNGEGRKLGPETQDLLAKARETKETLFP